MTYQKFKNRRHEIEKKISFGDYPLKDVLSTEDFDMLLYFINEYKELTTDLLLYIEERYKISVINKEDDKRLAQFLNLGK